MSVRDEAHRIAWSKVNHDTEPEGCVTALRALIDEYDRLRAEWIDPQRIVDLAKRYTDEGSPGRVDVTFYDALPGYGHIWYVTVRGKGAARMTLGEALRKVEE